MASIAKGEIRKRCARSFMQGGEDEQTRKRFFPFPPFHVARPPFFAEWRVSPVPPFSIAPFPGKARRKNRIRCVQRKIGSIARKKSLTPVRPFRNIRGKPR